MASLAFFGGWRRATRIPSWIPSFRGRSVGAAAIRQPATGISEVSSGTLIAVPYGTLSAVPYGTLSAVSKTG